MEVLREVYTERLRQALKGFTPARDDMRTDGSLRMCVTEVLENNPGHDDDDWVLGRTESILQKPLRQQLVICCALLVAEIERLDRRENMPLDCNGH